MDAGFELVDDEVAFDSDFPAAPAAPVFDRVVRRPAIFLAVEVELDFADVAFALRVESGRLEVAVLLFPADLAVVITPDLTVALDVRVFRPDVFLLVVVAVRLALDFGVVRLPIRFTQFACPPPSSP